MIRLVQNSFFGGQLDFEMMGRQDYQRYAKGATLLRNFNIMKRGGLDKRRGFDRILNLKTISGVSANTKFRAIPYAYKKSKGFVLLMSGPKCIIVGTNPVNQFKYYDVEGLDGVYTATEIQELDYQQCGDVIYLAHPNHKPAYIEHIINDAGEDGFHYYEMRVDNMERGIPSIIDSHVTRLPVKDDDKQASLFTEKYCVSAVFDGVETYPCAEYSRVANDPRGGSDWHGTNYPMPWTESQVIALTIRPVTRTTADGVTKEYPEEIRVYKKAYNYFGLIGTVKIDRKDTISKNNSIHSGSFGEEMKCSDDPETYDIFDTSDDIPSHGVGRSYRMLTSAVAINHDKNTVGGYVEIGIGGCRYEIAEDGNSVKFIYAGWNEGDIVAVNMTSGKTDTLHLPASVGVREEVIERLPEESDEVFSARWKSLYFDFYSTIPDTAKVVIPVPASSTRTTLSCTSEGGVSVNNIRFFAFQNIGDVVFQDKYITPDTSITPQEKDSEGTVFSKTGDYPSSVSLSQQRLIWASSNNDPARIWMSAIGDFENYSSHEILVPSDPIDFKLPVTRFAKINHICEMRKLLMFNSACEWLVDSSSSVQGITHETIQAYPQSYSGSSERLKPIICNNSLIFCERTGQAVRRFAYDISNDGFAGRDVSVLSASIFENNSIVDWTYQQFPYSTLWCVLANGDMASFEFMEEQDIMAWMTHRLGGNGKVVCVATSYAVSPAMDEVMNVESYEYATHEEIFAVVRRGDELWLERMRVRTRLPVVQTEPMVDSLYHTLCLDGMRVLNRSNGYTPTTEEGAVWIPKDTTDGKSISREEALEKLAAGVEVYEGFPYDAEYISVYPNINNGTLGNGQFDIKHIQGCGLRLMLSHGGTVKAVGSKFAEPIQYFYNDPENDHRAKFKDGKVTLFNHDTNIIALSGVNNRDGRVEIVQKEPYPFSVLAYEIDFEPETGGYRQGVLP